MSISVNDVESIVQIKSSDVERSQIQHENVQLSSAISHDSKTRVDLTVGEEKFAQLIDRLSSTHSQLDDYTQKRTHLISVETQKIIEKILEETKEQQRDLLVEAQQRSQQLQDQYQSDLQEKINQLNEEKAQQLAQLETFLNEQQQMILNAAKQQIDLVQKQANLLKMKIMNEAEAQTNAQVESIAEQVVLIGQEDSAQRLASSTTTVITTQAMAQSQEQQTYAQVTAQS